MAEDTVADTGGDAIAAAAAARATEQARLRKERREAKIKAGGAARLNRITGLGGGMQRDPPPTPPTTAAASTPKPSPPTGHAEHADPEEVDISQHYYAPPTTSRTPQPAATPPPLDPADLSEAQLRQMILGLGGPGGPGGPAAAADEDPMALLLKQMMGGAGAGGMPAPSLQPPQQQQQKQQEDEVAGRHAALWRLLHALVALGLGLYAALTTGFGGTRAEREAAGGGDEQARRAFVWAFATAEAGLLAARFLGGRGREAPPRGALWSLAALLPPPVKGCLDAGLRYGRMLGALRSDVLVCVFVLGACSWLRGGVGRDAPVAF